jgi:hypothetical protein
LVTTATSTQLPPPVPPPPEKLLLRHSVRECNAVFAIRVSLHDQSKRLAAEAIMLMDLLGDRA